MLYPTLLLFLFAMGRVSAADSTTAQSDTLSGTEVEYEISAIPDSSPPVDPGDSLPPLQRMPELVTFIEAGYPTDLQRAGIQGSVVLDLLVSDSGTVDSVALVQSLHPILDSSAVAAVRGFRFSPALADSQPVGVILQYEYRFSLTEVVRGLDSVVNFSGRILERGTRNPVADAMVVLSFLDTASDPVLPVPRTAYLERIGKFPGQYLEDDRLVTTTGSSGEFRFLSLPPGRMVVTVPLPGYEEYTEFEVIVPEEALIATYYVRRVSYADYEIVVYGKAQEKEISRRQLTMQEIRRIPGLGGDAVKVVQALPGVARPRFGGGEVIVRGSRTWDSRFLLDGVAIPQLYHYGGIKSTYNSDALASVDLYPGGFGGRYGGVIGGVVEITGRRAKTDRWHGKSDASFVDASVLVEGPVTKSVSVLATGRRSYVGDMLSWALRNIPGLNLPITVAPFYWDYVVRSDIDIARDNSAFVTFFGSKDAFELIIPGVRGGSAVIDEVKDRARQKTLFHLGMAGWDAKLSETWSNQARYAFTYGLASTSIFGIVKWDADSWEHQFREQLSRRISPRVTANAGIEVDFVKYRQESVFPVLTNDFLFDTLDGTYGLVGPYLAVEWKPLDRLLVAPSLRFDRFLELDYEGSVVPAFWNYHDFDNRQGVSGEPSLRLSTRYEYRKHHTIKAAVGNYSQTPQPTGLVTHERFGSPNHPATKAAHYVVGYEWQATDLLFADVQLWSNRQFDIPQGIIAADLTAGSLTRFVPTGKARMRGMELLIRHDQGRRFFGWLAYTLSLSERYNRATDSYELFEYDQPHNLQLVANYRLPREWEIGMRTRYVSGNPYTPIAGSVFDNDLRAYVSDSRKPRNSGRLDPFFQVDVRVDKKFIFRRSIMSLYLDVQNVSSFVYKSPEFLIPNYDPYDIKAGREDRMPISYPFLPSLGVTYEF